MLWCLYEPPCRSICTAAGQQVDKDPNYPMYRNILKPVHKVRYLNMMLFCIVTAVLGPSAVSFFGIIEKAII